jgi:hypothetical protein
MTLVRRFAPLALLTAGAACSSAPAAPGVEDSALSIADLPVAMQTPKPGQFDQQIDHHSKVGTFKQRYWIGSDFATARTAP